MLNSWQSLGLFFLFVLFFKLSASEKIITELLHIILFYLLIYFLHGTKIAVWLDKPPRMANIYRLVVRGIMASQCLFASSCLHRHQNCLSADHNCLLLTHQNDNHTPGEV